MNSRIRFKVVRSSSSSKKLNFQSDHKKILHSYIVLVKVFSVIYNREIYFFNVELISFDNNVKKNNNDFKFFLKNIKPAFKTSKSCKCFKYIFYY